MRREVGWEHSLDLVPDDRRSSDFWVGNMIPTVIDDDIEAARARNRRDIAGLCRAAQLSQLLD